VTHEAIRCTFRTIRHNSEGAPVQFTHGRKCRYHGVIGADGLNSKVRDLFFPNAPSCAIAVEACDAPCWRARTISAAPSFGSAPR